MILVVFSSEIDLENWKIQWTSILNNFLSGIRQFLMQTIFKYDDLN